MVRHTDADDDGTDEQTKAHAFDAMQALTGDDDVPEFIVDEVGSIDDPNQIIDLAVTYVDGFDDPRDDGGSQ
jgi:hypothetical protein